MKVSHSFLLFSLVFSPWSLAEKRQLSSHEHGSAHLNIAIDQETLVAELESPAINLLGFEHKPQTSDELNMLKQLESQFLHNQQLLHFNPEADCKLIATNFQLNHDDEHDDKDHNADEAMSKEIHSAIVAHWKFNCTDPSALSRLTFGLIKQYEHLDKVKLEYIGPNRQGSSILNKENNSVTF